MKRWFSLLPTSSIRLEAESGFFVEVGIDDGKGQAVVLRSFSRSNLLEDYAFYMQLPD